LGHGKYSNKFVLVDTAGFDDANTTKQEVLQMINEWMTKTFVGLSRGIVITLRTAGSGGLASPSS